jgi:uncharacterized protein
MKEGLLQLLELQEIDKELKALEEAKDKYPAEIAERQEEIGQATETLRMQEEELEECEKSHRTLERELETARESLVQHEARFTEVTNNREYDALQLEIDSNKTKISECETQILQRIERAEELKSAIDAEKEEVDGVREEKQARIDELQEKLNTLQDQVSGVEEKRRNSGETIPRRLFTIYERSRKPPGMRLAAVRKGSCGVCFRQLPPQARSNVRRSEELLYCEHCGAIQVWDEESS